MAYNSSTDFTLTPLIYAIDVDVANNEASVMTIDVYELPDDTTPIFSSGIAPSGNLNERVITGTDNTVRATVSVGGSVIDTKEIIPYNYINEPLTDEMKVVIQGLDGVEHNQIISKLKTLFESNTDIFDDKDAKIIITCIEKFYASDKELFTRRLFEFCRRNTFELNDLLTVTLTRQQRIRILSIFFDTAKTRIGNRIDYLTTQLSTLDYLYNITPSVSNFIWLDT